MGWPDAAPGLTTQWRESGRRHRQYPVTTDPGGPGNVPDRRRYIGRSRSWQTLWGIKRIAAKLAHFDGAYLRFVGDIEISRYRGGELVETHKDDAIWELMYFGHARDQ